MSWLDDLLNNAPPVPKGLLAPPDQPPPNGLAAPQRFREGGLLDFPQTAATSLLGQAPMPNYAAMLNSVPPAPWNPGLPGAAGQGDRSFGWDRIFKARLAANELPKPSPAKPTTPAPDLTQAAANGGQVSWTVQRLDGSSTNPQSMPVADRIAATARNIGTDPMRPKASAPTPSSDGSGGNPVYYNLGLRNMNVRDLPAIAAAPAAPAPTISGGSGPSGNPAYYNLGLRNMDVGNLPAVAASLNAPAPLSQGGSRATLDSGGQKYAKFFDQQFPSVIKIAARRNVDPALLLGLAAYESGWGKSGNNYDNNFNPFGATPLGDGTSGLKFSSYDDAWEKWDQMFGSRIANLGSNVDAFTTFLELDNRHPVDVTVGTDRHGAYNIEKRKEWLTQVPLTIQSVRDRLAKWRGNLDSYP